MRIARPFSAVFSLLLAHLVSGCASISTPRTVIETPERAELAEQCGHAQVDAVASINEDMHQLGEIDVTGMYRGGYPALAFRVPVDIGASAIALSRDAERALVAMASNAEWVRLEPEGNGRCRSRWAAHADAAREFLVNRGVAASRIDGAAAPEGLFQWASGIQGEMTGRCAVLVLVMHADPRPSLRPGDGAHASQPHRGDEHDSDT